MQRYLKRRYVLPPEHGAWVWWIGPLCIGLAAAPALTLDALLFAGFASTAYLFRHPVVLLMQRRDTLKQRGDWSVVLFWAGCYGLAAGSLLAILLFKGYWGLCWFALPILPVTGYYGWLLQHKNTRGQLALDLSGAAILGLTGPAAYYVGGGQELLVMVLVWFVPWLQSMISIIHVQLRLQQRLFPALPALAERVKQGWLPIGLYSVSLVISFWLWQADMIHVLVTVAFILVALEGFWAVFQPPVGFRVVRIGLQQLVVSSIFMILTLLGFARQLQSG